MGLERARERPRNDVGGIHASYLILIAAAEAARITAANASIESTTTSPTSTSRSVSPEGGRAPLNSSAGGSHSVSRSVSPTSLTRVKSTSYCQRYAGYKKKELEFKMWVQQQSSWLADVNLSRIGFGDLEYALFRLAEKIPSHFINDLPYIIGGREETNRVHIERGDHTASHEYPILVWKRILEGATSGIFIEPAAELCSIQVPRQRTRSESGSTKPHCPWTNPNHERRATEPALRRNVMELKSWH